MEVLTLANASFFVELDFLDLLDLVVYKEKDIHEKPTF